MRITLISVHTVRERVTSCLGRCLRKRILYKSCINVCKWSKSYSKNLYTQWGEVSVNKLHKVFSWQVSVSLFDAQKNSRTLSVKTHPSTDDFQFVSGVNTCTSSWRLFCASQWKDNWNAQNFLLCYHLLFPKNIFRTFLLWQMWSR